MGNLEKVEVSALDHAGQVPEIANAYDGDAATEEIHAKGTTVAVDKAKISRQTLTNALGGSDGPEQSRNGQASNGIEKDDAVKNHEKTSTWRRG